MGERESTPPPPLVNPTIHIPDDPQEPSSAKKDNNSMSILEKTKKKAKVECDELKEKLKKVLAKNEELKKAYNNHVEIIDDLNNTLAAQAKVIDTLTSEFDEVNAKYENMNKVNKMLHQMIGELHESSSNESKVLIQEIEALRVDKVVKEEQLNMLYVVMEHKLGINVQAVKS
ncbi:hypothetical protein Hanom_Chr11g01024821 [Helianthus anomalus]